MKNSILKFNLLYLIIILGITQGYAQDIGDTASIKTKDGNTFYGIIHSMDNDAVSFQTEDLGLITIEKDRIKRISPATKREDGTYWFTNPNTTRNLFGPTAFALKKGEAYYQNSWLVLHTLNYGVTDHFTIGGGFEIISLLWDDSPSFPAFVITPKFSTASDKNINFAGGFIYLHAGDLGSDDDSFDASILYGVSTFGNKENNFSLGVGMGRAEGEWAKHPIVTLSGMLRVSKHFGLVTENWILSFENERSSVENGVVTTTSSYEPSILFSAGGRYIAPSITVDIAVILSNEGGGGPWLGVTIPFGER